MAEIDTASLAKPTAAILVPVTEAMVTAKSAAAKKEEKDIAAIRAHRTDVGGKVDGSEAR